MTHKDLANSSRPAPRGATRIGDVDPAAPVELTVTLTGPGLEPVGVRPARPLDAAAYAARLGAAPAAVRKASEVLGRHGLTVAGQSRDRRSLRVRGSAGQVQAAFKTQLGLYSDPHHHAGYRGREGGLAIPEELEGIVTGVFGLDQRRMVRHAGAAPKAAGWSIAEIERRYRFPPGQGAGQCIGIAEFGFGAATGHPLMPAYLPEDVKAFCRLQGRPAPVPEIVPIAHAPLSPAEYGHLMGSLPAMPAKLLRFMTIETMMDIELVAGLCPGARIVVYFSTFDEKGAIDLLDRVLDGAPTPTCFSVSYGLAEDDDNWSEAALHEIELRLHAAALQGITICAAAGDDGSGGKVSDGRAHVVYPASSPHALAVGGTMLEGGDEVAWWEAPGARQPDGTGAATGGGVSGRFSRPPWQAQPIASLNAGARSGRVVPDVAALAGSPGYDLVVAGERASHGGTSAAAPVWAALIARLSEARGERGFLPPLLYAAGKDGHPVGASGCRDVTQGHNASSPSPGKGYRAGKGFDAVSGWGVPDGTALLKALS